MRFTRSWPPRMWRRAPRLLDALARGAVVLGSIASIEVGLVLFGSALIGLVLLESTLMRSIIVEGQRQQHALTQIRPLMGELPLNIRGWAADAILIHNT